MQPNPARPPPRMIAVASGKGGVGKTWFSITLAHAMGIEVTAEGVETRNQFQMLRDMQCNTFQGYLMSAPVTPDALSGLFSEQPRLRMVQA